MAEKDTKLTKKPSPSATSRAEMHEARGSLRTPSDDVRNSLRGTSTALNNPLGLGAGEADESKMALNRHADPEYMNHIKSLLGPKSSAFVKDSLAPGEEFVETPPEQLLQKGVLDASDILRAKPSTPAFDDIQVGILGGGKGLRGGVYLTGKALDEFKSTSSIMAPDNLKNFRTSTLGATRRELAREYLGEIAALKAGELHPKLVRAMQRDPDVNEFAKYAMTAAKTAGLNPNLLANQLWAESSFNEDAVGPLTRHGRALGIGQAMPKFFMGRYGLESVEDFRDGRKSIDAAVGIMSDLTNKYKDQRLGMVAYNGGDGAIDFVAKRLGKTQITFNEWYGYMEKLQETTAYDPSSWAHQTLPYVQKIGATPGDPAPVKPAGPDLIPR